MPFDKSKKRRKPGKAMSKGRRKTRRKRELGAGAFNVIRAALLVLMVLVFSSGIGVPLCLYFADSDDNNYISGEESGEYFTDEQQQELLAVISKAKPLDSDFAPRLAQVQDIQVNALAGEALKNMLAAAQADEVNLQIDSGYIPYEEQKSLYQEAYNSIKEQSNITSIKAEAQTVKSVPKAGESEAQTGLLIVFSDRDEENFNKSRSFSWLSENAVSYGFVLRYPQGKEDITAMDYNPAAYRFTGQKNALQMRILDMCLEEFAEYNALK